MNGARLPFLQALLLAIALLLASFSPAGAAPAEVAGGTGTKTHFGATATGFYSFHFEVSDYSVRHVAHWALLSDLTPEVVAEINAARASVPAYDAAVAKLPGRQCTFERAPNGVIDTMVEDYAWNTHAGLCFALGDAMQAVYPPVPVWRVVPLTTGDGSRPMYPVVNRVRSTTAVGAPKAPGNALCACTTATALPVGATRQRWCPVAGLPQNLVAVCGRRS